VKRQIEFLDALVRDLSSKQPTIINAHYVDRCVEKYRYELPRIWMSTGTQKQTGALGTTAGSTSLANYTQNLIS
jgi:hypothetical protein